MNKTKSRTEYSLINLITGFAGYFVNTLSGYICRVVFVRCLTAEYLGISGLFSNILGMLSLAELGIGSAMIYALYKPAAENDQPRIASLMKFYGFAYRIVAGFVALAGVALMPILPVIIKNPPSIHENLYVIYILFLLNTVVGYLFSYRGSLFLAMQRNYVVVGGSYVVTILQSIIQIVFLLATHRYMAYLIIQIFFGISYNVWVSWKARRDYPYIAEKGIEPLAKDERLNLLKDVKALAVYKLTGVLVHSTDNIVISFFNGLISVGLVSNYTLLTSTLSKLVSQIFDAMTGSIGNLIATESKERQYSFFRSLSLLNFWIYGWGTIGIVFVSEDLVRLFFGAGYVMDMKIPIILAVNFYIVGMQTAIYSYKTAMGIFRHGQYVLCFTAGLNLVLDFIFGYYWGIFGIFLATAIARVLTNAWYEPYIVFHYGFRINPLQYLRIYIKYIVVLLAAALLCYLICRHCSYSPFLNVILKVVICSAIPNIMFFIVYRNAEEFSYIKKVERKLFRKLVDKKRII